MPEGQDLALPLEQWPQLAGKAGREEEKYGGNRLHLVRQVPKLQLPMKLEQGALTPILVERVKGHNVYCVSLLREGTEFIL